MYSHTYVRCLTHYTTADVRLDSGIADGHHWRVSDVTRQPVDVVVSLSVLAVASQSTEQEGQSAKMRSQDKVLV